ncbi:hypothetical protein H6G80_11260 [Nostoc sp. FACHB-87]|uniref:hypothetical protein n=1 Tax=Nostocaceae TaxID=1162 RepID=UPI0016887490|nr:MULTISPECIES: hypothetical protein [Nostocaceae]MBD2301993.1 hypothetical protein [Nostoc sp. FACHB-190]MBD2454659.1 hypothetical protein [Nostoc sp. FACHB-87]MBD2475922.1 hypothetical protein [Anabaena sp. FACHB-83]
MLGQFESLNARDSKTFSPAWLMSGLVLSAVEVAEPLPSAIKQTANEQQLAGSFLEKL